MKNQTAQTAHRPPAMERWVHGAAGETEIRHPTGAVQTLDAEHLRAERARLAARQKALNDAMGRRIAEIDVVLDTLVAEAGGPARKVEDAALRQKVAARLGVA